MRNAPDWADHETADVIAEWNKGGVLVLLIAASLRAERERAAQLVYAAAKCEAELTASVKMLNLLDRVRGKTDA